MSFQMTSLYIYIYIYIYIHIYISMMLEGTMNVIIHLALLGEATKCRVG